MPDISRFSPRIPSGVPPGGRGRPPAGPEAPREPVAQPHLEAMPAVRPDLGSIERPTLEQVVDAVLRPAFLAADMVEPREFIDGLKQGAARLGERPGDPAAAGAAQALAEALADKELLDACCLFLLKG